MESHSFTRQRRPSRGAVGAMRHISRVLLKKKTMTTNVIEIQLVNRRLWKMTFLKFSSQLVHLEEGSSWEPSSFTVFFNREKSRLCLVRSFFRVVSGIRSGDRNVHPSWPPEIKNIILPYKIELTYLQKNDPEKQNSRSNNCFDNDVFELWSYLIVIMAPLIETHLQC